MKKLTIRTTPLESTLGWCYFVFQLLFLAPALVVINLFLPDPLGEAELNILLFVFNFIAIILILHRFLWKNLQKSFSAPFHTLKTAGIGFILYHISSVLISLLVYTLDPDFVNANDDNIGEMIQNNYTLMSLCTVLLVPVVEETLYRGLIFRCLYEKNALLGYILSTVLFAFIHVAGYIGFYDGLTLVLCFLQYLPAGIFLAWAYVKADSIWAPILIHITVNQIGILAMR